MDLSLKDRYYLEHYGITYAEKIAIYKSQKQLCLFCHNPMFTIRQAVVDHDHETGKIRGLLHSSCNRDLGKLESGYLIKQANQYLKDKQAVMKWKFQKIPKKFIG